MVPMRQPRRTVCYFHVVLGPLSTSEWRGSNSKTFLRAFGDIFFFPRGLSRVVATVRDPNDEAGSFFVHAAVKIHGDMKVSAVLWKFEAICRKNFPMIFPPAVPPALPDPVPIEVKGVAGWDRLCRRLLAEGLGQTPPAVVWEVLPEDMEDFYKCLATFQRSGGSPDTGGRTRRPLETYRRTKAKRGEKRGPRGGKGGGKW